MCIMDIYIPIISHHNRRHNRSYFGSFFRLAVDCQEDSGCRSPRFLWEMPFK